MPIDSCSKMSRHDARSDRGRAAHVPSESVRDVKGAWFRHEGDPQKQSGCVHGDDITTTVADVTGIDEAKDELGEVIGFPWDPKRCPRSMRSECAIGSTARRPFIVFMVELAAMWIRTACARLP